MVADKQLVAKKTTSPCAQVDICSMQVLLYHISLNLKVSVLYNLDPQHGWKD